MDRLTIVSCDCHAAASPVVYRDYLEAAYRARYDALLADPAAVARRAADIIGPFAPSGDGDGERDPLSARWSMSRRLAELDRDGIAAEVIFPQPAGKNAPPFYNIFGHPFDPNDPAAAAAGCRAYNRWLADFLRDSPAPERHAGLALVGIVDDVPAAVKEIEWAAQGGSARRHPAQPAALGSRLARPALRADLVRLRGPRAPDPYPWRRGPRARQPARRDLDLLHRGLLVRPPSLLASALVRRPRTPSEAPPRLHRAVRRLGAGHAEAPRHAVRGHRLLRDPDLGPLDASPPTTGRASAASGPRS